METGALLKIYSGTLPAVDAPVTGQVLLEMSLDDGPAIAASGGVLDLSETAEDPNSGGTFLWVRETLELKLVADGPNDWEKTG